jgi:hypothetical protein
MVQPSPPDETIEEGKKAAQTGPVTQSEKLIELFNREKIDPSGKKILAFAILFERQVAPAVWVGPGPDPFAVEGENAETSQARFLASKIVPGYQPHFIPAHLTIDTDTFVAGRPLRKGESLEVAHINQVLAVMLADLLADQDLSKCSALSLSGESVALGQNRFAIVVGGAPVTREEGEQEDTHPAQDTAMKVKSSEDMQVTSGLDTEGEKDIKEYDVFISYSSQDKIIADAICATLENRKIRCWIAPRNVPMDKPFGTAVVNAIRGSRSFVLVLSEGSSNSASVLREVSEAFDNGIPIVPFRIQDVEPSEKLSFYIKSLYCLDAIRPPIERNLAKLADAIQALLPVSADAESPEPQNK